MEALSISGMIAEFVALLVSAALAVGLALAERHLGIKRRQFDRVIDLDRFDKIMARAARRAVKARLTSTFNGRLDKGLYPEDPAVSDVVDYVIETSGSLAGSIIGADPTTVAGRRALAQRATAEIVDAIEADQQKEARP